MDLMKSWKTAAGWIATAVCLALSGPGFAMDDSIGIDCVECRYPTAIQMPSCSGVYMGNGLVVTAAHCIDDVWEGSSKARFGEDDSNPAYEFVIQSCETHPDGEPDTNAWGEPSWHGPDIGYCILEDTVNNDLAAIPVVPPFIPNGCERDWLAHRVYESGSKPIVTVVGSGCADVVGPLENCGDGVKRFAGRQLERQTTYGGSSTKLQLHRDLWGDSDTGLRPGDSGGGVFIMAPKLGDSTWRVIGVNSMKAFDDYAEALPPYLRWIEASSGIDITPNHTYSNAHSKWVVNPMNPTAFLPRYKHNANWGAWPFQCSTAPRGYSDSYTTPSGFLCELSDLDGLDEYAAQEPYDPSSPTSRGDDGLYAGNLQTKQTSSYAPQSFLPLEENGNEGSPNFGVILPGVESYNRLSR